MRSAEEECPRKGERDHLVLSGEWRGPVRALGVGWAVPSRAGALTGAAADAGRLAPLP
jgi:hypothetical protein